MSLLITNGDEDATGFPTQDLPKSTCPYTDKGNRVSWVAFLYGLAVTTPFNFIILTLPFYNN